MAKYRKETHDAHMKHIEDYDNFNMSGKKLDAILIGADIMERFKWDSAAKKAYIDYGLDKFNILNFSCTGDKLQNILYRSIANYGEYDYDYITTIFDKIAIGSVPKVIIFMCGENDIETIKPSKMFSLFEKIYQEYCGPYNDFFKVVVIGMYPRLSNLRSSEKIVKLCEEYNNKLKKLQRCEYYEMDKLLDSNGNINKKYLIDFVNLNNSGYEILAEKIKYILNEHIPHVEKIEPIPNKNKYNYYISSTYKGSFEYDYDNEFPVLKKYYKSKTCRGLFEYDYDNEFPAL